MDSAVEGARYMSRPSEFIEHFSSQWKTLHEVYSLLDRTGEFEEAVTRIFLLLNERHRLGPCFLSLVNEEAKETRTEFAVGVSGRARSLARYRIR